MKRKFTYLHLLLFVLMSVFIFNSCRNNKTTTQSIKDETVIWDKQVRNGQTCLLVQKLVGFQDVMEGIALYRYPNELDQSLEKYDKKYQLFDLGVDDIYRKTRNSTSVVRSVKSAKLDFKKKQVLIEFDGGPSQVLDISKYEF